MIIGEVAKPTIPVTVNPTHQDRWLPGRASEHRSSLPPVTGSSPIPGYMRAAKRRGWPSVTVF
jgi:hypothetical protein